jgi:hypothetical protein
MKTILFLARLHYDFGLIGYDEFVERIKIAEWLIDEGNGQMNDPRDQNEEVVPHSNEEVVDISISETVVSQIDGGEAPGISNEENWLEIICLGIWVFTKADPDPYPSVPHGHFQSQSKQWPKLNPYTGRVYVSKHQEDKTRRLTKKQMKKIWTDEKFKSFCREMIVWYLEQYSYHVFPVKSPLRMPRW